MKIIFLKISLKKVQFLNKMPLNVYLFSIWQCIFRQKSVMCCVEHLYKKIDVIHYSSHFFLSCTKKDTSNQNNIIPSKIIYCFKLITQSALLYFLFIVTPFRAIRKYHKQFVLDPNSLVSQIFKDVLNNPTLWFFLLSRVA